MTPPPPLSALVGSAVPPDVTPSPIHICRISFHHFTITLLNLSLTLFGPSASLRIMLIPLVRWFIVPFDSFCRSSSSPILLDRSNLAHRLAALAMMYNTVGEHDVGLQELTFSLLRSSRDSFSSCFAASSSAPSGPIRIRAIS